MCWSQCRIDPTCHFLLTREKYAAYVVGLDAYKYTWANTFPARWVNIQSARTGLDWVRWWLIFLRYTTLCRQLSARRKPYGNENQRSVFSYAIPWIQDLLLQFCQNLQRIRRMQFALGQTFAFKRKKLRVPVSVLTTLSFDGRKMDKKNKKTPVRGLFACYLAGRCHSQYSLNASPMLVSQIFKMTVTTFITTVS